MHRFLSLLLSGLIYFVMNSGLHAQLPTNYQDLSAEEKQTLLWSAISKSHEEIPLPPLREEGFLEALEKLKALFNLKPTFDYSRDELPEGRIKIIHANGSVGKVAFIPVANHPFTGIYQTGGSGLARLSLATSPSDNTYIPAMAIKILIAKNPSLNLHVMNSLEGQNENWNFFSNDFSNQIAHPSGWLLTAIETIFTWTRDPANDLPLWHLAAWTSEGKYKGIPIFPERIYFRPTSLVKNLISEQSREDFRNSLLKVPFGPIYELYGEYQGVEYHVGTLMLESPLLASNYGDNNLFFQHQR